MGQTCYCCNNNLNLEMESVLNFKNKIGDIALGHVIDIGNDSFAKKICKENSFYDMRAAHLWVHLYKVFMIYLAWQFDQYYQNKKATPEMSSYLCLPFEVLQVWKLHVLYTENYMDFCLKLTNRQLTHFNFMQPFLTWKYQNIKVVRKNFEVNKRYIQALANVDKRAINAIFVFQASYLKNILNFNIYERTSTSKFVVEIFQQELFANNLNMLKIKAKNLESLVVLADQIENVIKNCITADDNIEPPKPWRLSEKFATEENLKEAEIIQNMELAPDFAYFFARHHLMSLKMANLFIDEYKKYVFLVRVTKRFQTPSEETDQVWHYHISYLNEYIAFSRNIMKKTFHHHNPSEGKANDDKVYIDFYKLTKDDLKAYFDDVNTIAWPESQIRFTKFYKWKTFPYFAKESGIWNQRIFEKSNENYDVSSVGNGCINGCGAVNGEMQMTKSGECFLECEKRSNL